MRKERQSLYKTKAWHRLRARQLRRQPFCQCPHCEGKQVRAEVVDHIVPHRGDQALFFSSSNLQSLTKQCHDSAKQVVERSGYWPGCDESGIPVDKGHHWYNEGHG